MHYSPHTSFLKKKQKKKVDWARKGLLRKADILAVSRAYKAVAGLFVLNFHSRKVLSFPHWWVVPLFLLDEKVAVAINCKIYTQA